MLKSKIAVYVQFLSQDFKVQELNNTRITVKPFLMNCHNPFRYITWYLLRYTMYSTTSTKIYGTSH